MASRDLLPRVGRQVQQTQIDQWPAFDVKMFVGGDDNSVVVKFHPRLYWDASLLPRPERSYWVSRTLFVPLADAGAYYTVLREAGYKVVGNFVTGYIENQ
jgi:hypothetical protein